MRPETPPASTYWRAIASEVAHWMKIHDAFCCFSLACEATASEKPPSAGNRPAGPFGSGATARQSPSFEVFGSVKVP